jgi:flagellar motor switch protein FliG
VASGIRKAAILLMSLDTATATELLKATKPELVTEIVAELAILRKSGAPKDTASTVKEFAVMLNQGGGGNSDSFVRHMLEGALCREKSGEIMGKVAGILNSRDPFLPLRQAGVSEVCQVLQGESAMVVALVLT